MKVNEFRVGNFIYWDIPEKKGTVHKISRITTDNLNTTPISLGKSINDYKPIPLTELWLVKLGFEKIAFLDFKHKNLKRENIVDGGCILKFANDYSRTNEGDITTIESRGYNIIGYDIKFVHQLQNIVFFLSGEELV